MRIVLFDPAAGGHHSEYAFHLSRYLVEHGDTVSLVTWRNDPRWRLVAESNDVTFKCVVDGAAPDLGNHPLRRLARIRRSLQMAIVSANESAADILHLLYLDHSEVATWLALHFDEPRRFPIVGTLWWPYFLHQEGDYPGLGRSSYHAVVASTLKHLYRREELSHLFVHSERIRNLACQSLDVALEDCLNRTTLIPDPSLPPSEMSMSQAREMLGLPDDRPLLLFFGALRADKGPRVLLDALPYVEQECTVLFAGPPADVREGEIAQATPLTGDKVRILAHLRYVDDADVPHYFAAANAVLLPYSTAFKGTSGVLQRAAAAQTPVLATDVGDIGDTVRSHRLGWVIEPHSPQVLADKVNAILKDPRSLERVVGEQAKSYVSHSDWRVSGRIIRETYQSIRTSTME